MLARLELGTVFGEHTRTVLPGNYFLAAETANPSNMETIVVAISRVRRENRHCTQESEASIAV
jgi:hypothetical protein